MNLSVERTLSAKVAWFEKNVGMKRSDVARTMLNLPALFAYSIEDNIEPKVSVFWTVHLMQSPPARAWRVD